MITPQTAWDLIGFALGIVTIWAGISGLNSGLGR